MILNCVSEIQRESIMRLIYQYLRSLEQAEAPKMQAKAKNTSVLISNFDGLCAVDRGCLQYFVFSQTENLIFEINLCYIIFLNDLFCE